MEERREENVLDVAQRPGRSFELGIGKLLWTLKCQIRGQEQVEDWAYGGGV